MRACDAKCKSIENNWECLARIIKDAIIDATNNGQFNCLVPTCKINVKLDVQRLRVLGYNVSNFRDDNAPYGCKECVLISWKYA